jgi:hypothetical protein
MLLRESYYANQNYGLPIEGLAHEVNFFSGSKPIPEFLFCFEIVVFQMFLQLLLLLLLKWQQ